MNPEELKQILQVLMETKQAGLTVVEWTASITASIVCLITICTFIRSVIKAGFEPVKIQNDKQEKVLDKINATLSNFRVDCVTHDVCAKRQDKFIERLGLKDMRRRIERLEDKDDDSGDK